MHACRAARTLHQGQPAPAPAAVLGLSCSGTHCGHTTLPHGRHGPMHTASALDEAQGAPKPLTCRTREHHLYADLACTDIALAMHLDRLPSHDCAQARKTCADGRRTLEPVWSPRHDTTRVRPAPQCTAATGTTTYSSKKTAPAQHQPNTNPSQPTAPTGMRPPAVVAPVRARVPPTARL